MFRQILTGLVIVMTTICVSLPMSSYAKNPDRFPPISPIGQEPLLGVALIETECMSLSQKLFPSFSFLGPSRFNQ